MPSIESWDDLSSLEKSIYTFDDTSQLRVTFWEAFDVPAPVTIVTTYSYYESIAIHSQAL